MVPQTATCEDNPAIGRDVRPEVVRGRIFVQ